MGLASGNAVMLADRRWCNQALQQRLECPICLLKKQMLVCPFKAGSFGGHSLCLLAGLEKPWDPPGRVQGRKRQSRHPGYLGDQAPVKERKLTHFLFHRHSFLFKTHDGLAITS